MNFLPDQDYLHGKPDKLNPPAPAWADPDARKKPGDANTCRDSHVLIVEDDKLMRDMLVETLESMGCRVTPTETAFHWMDYCVGNATQRPRDRYDLVISDIRLPGISGLEVLEGLRAEHDNPPTILITAYGDQETHERANQLGAIAVLNKPFAVQSLVNLVRSALT